MRIRESKLSAIDGLGCHTGVGANLRLKCSSDADADVLADYVLALLRHDGDVQDVRRLCETEIPDFLKEDSSVFVNDVFEAITHKSYLPGAPPPPPRQPVLPQLPAGVAAQFPPGQPVGLPYDDIPLAQPPQFPPAFHNQNGSKKRAYGDWSDALDAQTGRDSRYGGRGAKQPRRGAGSGPGSRGGRSEDSNGFKRPGSSSFQQAGLISAGAFPAGVPGNGGWEPNAALEALFNTFASQSQPPRRRARCRDYDTKGYCARGNTCMFEHGDDSIYLPTVPGFGAPESAGQSAAVEEYDPTNALMPNIFNTLPNAQQFGMPDAGHGFRGRGGRGGRHENGPQKRRGKAPFSADGPVFDKTRSTIVVESIPEDHFTEEHVRTFFSQFGNILEVSMQPYKRLAIVKFDSWAAANAAYKSPKVVFDNRFVKVFWYKEDDNSILPPSMPLNGGGSAAGGAKGGSATGTSEADGMTAEPEIDMEEFMRKQEEAQKNHEEKSKKLQEVERQLEEIEKKQQELLARQREEKARLQAKLAQKAKSSRGGSVQSEGDGESSKPSNHSEVLRAQLAKLEAEAEELGIDPHAIVDEPLPDWHAPRGGYAGGYRGRGAPFRARGYAPRAFRGGFRGGRGNHHAAYAAYSLDNRPKKVILTGVDFTESEKDETLRQYLFVSVD